MYDFAEAVMMLQQQVIDLKLESKTRNEVTDEIRNWDFDTIQSFPGVRNWYPAYWCSKAAAYYNW